MPKQPKSQSSIPPAKLIPGTKDPILSTGPPRDAEDWKIKNARAKELIMSTLVPGSEPWKIAEPLELASDIWKALEARYARIDPKIVADATNAETQPVRADSTTQQAHTSAKIAEEVKELDIEAQARKEAQVRATKEFHESMPNRDQRFLWALLHGGKEETNAWFYGTTVET